MAALRAVIYRRELVSIADAQHLPKERHEPCAFSIRPAGHRMCRFATDLHERPPSRRALAASSTSASNDDWALADMAAGSIKPGRLPKD